MSSLLLILASQVVLPGTQPGDLTILPQPSSTCGCHDSFDLQQETEPGQSYKATMMALAGRDPIFRAAFRVANRDRPEVTDLCLRCHTPMAWLGGRSTPGDGSALTPEDLESITCDVCHRMVPAMPQLIGDGQMTLSPLPNKRAQRGQQGMAVHPIQQSDYQQTSEMCGVCHSLFNPAESAHGPDGTDFGFPYYEQRTYEEWADSAFNTRGISCIDCHMERAMGARARLGTPVPDMAVHRIVGANWFVPEAVAMLNPGLGIENDVPAVQEAVYRSLSDAVTLTITSTIPNDLTARNERAVHVRHPCHQRDRAQAPVRLSGGRRMYLEVAIHLGDDVTVVSGAWDEASGDLIRDTQLRTYETEHGRYEAGTSTPTHHIVFANQIISDTRIPPEGSRRAFPDMVPSGRDYGTEPYRHWTRRASPSKHRRSWTRRPAPSRIRAMYQITDGDYVRFLLREAAGSTEAADLETVWEALGHAPPREMKRVSFPITVMAAPIPDAGMPDTGAPDSGRPDTGAVDAGVRDTGSVDSGGGGEEEDDGCGCTSTERSAGFGFLPLLLLLLPLVRRRIR